MEERNRGEGSMREKQENTVGKVECCKRKQGRREGKRGNMERKEQRRKEKGRKEQGRREQGRKKHIGKGT